MDLTEFRPRPMLVTKETSITKPRFPVIDAHNHLGSEFGGGWDKRPVNELIDIMDEAGVRSIVDLDGGWGDDILNNHLDHIKSAAPDRFFMYGGIRWNRWQEYGDRFGEWAAKDLRAQAARGAQGLKVWKNFGLLERDQKGELVRINDPRLDPVWETVGELNWPVTIHIADPVAFFDPLDETNERWEELHAHPDWQFPSPPFPPFLQVVNDMIDMVARHPNTTYIGAHFGCYAEDLNWVARALDRCPNFNVDISERVGELGRQPYSARNSSSSMRSASCLAWIARCRRRNTASITASWKRMTRTLRMALRPRRARVAGECTAYIFRRTCWKKCITVTPNA